MPFRRERPRETGSVMSLAPTDCEIPSHEDAIIEAVKRQPEDSSRDIA